MQNGANGDIHGFSSPAHSCLRFRAGLYALVDLKHSRWATNRALRDDPVFDAFFTTRTTVGRGIGLFVAKQFVEGHGGCISIESDSESEKHGTTPATLPATSYKLRVIWKVALCLPLEGLLNFLENDGSSLAPASFPRFWPVSECAFLMPVFLINRAPKCIQLAIVGFPRLAYFLEMVQLGWYSLSVVGLLAMNKQPTEYIAICSLPALPLKND